MLLSDKTIMKMLEEKSLTITPIEPEQIQPASVDIRLGNTFSIVEDSSTGVITLESEITIPASVNIIESDAFYECMALAVVNIEDLSAWCNITFKSPSSNPN